MGATRPASGIKAKAHTLNKGSQTALITRLFVSLCLNARRESKLLKKTKRDEAADKIAVYRVKSSFSSLF